jgi:hypothetical protein
MKKIILGLSIILAFCSCEQTKMSNGGERTLYDSSYKPAVFTDPARMEKIKLAFPVIEKIYKDYADSNHFPGIAFGVVVDGKLVFWFHRY